MMSLLNIDGYELFATNKICTMVSALHVVLKMRNSQFKYVQRIFSIVINNSNECTILTVERLTRN